MPNLIEDVGVWSVAVEAFGDADVRVWGVERQMGRGLDYLRAERFEQSYLFAAHFFGHGHDEF